MAESTPQLLKLALANGSLQDSENTSIMMLDDVLAFVCKQLNCDAVFAIKSCHSNNTFSASLEVVDTSITTVVSHFRDYLSFQGQLTQAID